MNKILILLSVTLFFLLCLHLYHYATDIDVYTIDSGKPGPTILIVGGTHGNEPAGSIAIEEFMKSNPKLKRGKVILAPRLNKVGLLLNKRWLYHRIGNNDLNRNYPTDDGEAKDPINKTVMELTERSDFILDFHEGWGFHKIQPKSMGSGIYPSGTKKSIEMAYELIESLNQTIPNPDKHFIVGHEDRKGTYINYARYCKKNYLLIETTGQKDIQPIRTRVDQSSFIIDFVLKKMAML